MVHGNSYIKLSTIYWIHVGHVPRYSKHLPSQGYEINFEIYLKFVPKNLNWILHTYSSCACNTYCHRITRFLGLFLGYYSEHCIFETWVGVFPLSGETLEGIYSAGFERRRYYHSVNTLGTLSTAVLHIQNTHSIVTSSVNCASFSSCNFIYLLRAISLTPGGSSTVHIYTK